MRSPCARFRVPPTVFAAMVAYPLAFSDAAAFAQRLDLVVEPAEEWSALFDRLSGWTGADGIYSIPLLSDDAPGSAYADFADSPRPTGTAFVFGDTFIGEVDPETDDRLPGTAMVNNTGAYLPPFAPGKTTPDPDDIVFFWGRDEQGEPEALFVPDTPDSRPGDWYWVKDGFVPAAADRDGGGGGAEAAAYLFAYRFRPDRDEPAGYLRAGVSLIVVPAGDRPPNFPRSRQVEAPLFVPEEDGGAGRGDAVFGAGVLVNTAAAGTPDPDGFVYVYGTRDDRFNKKLLAARVGPRDVENFDEYRFWNGAAWVAGAADAAPIAERVSNELSVTPWEADGDAASEYLLVFQLDAIGRFIGLRVGQSPIGPWGEVQAIYECPEALDDPEGGLTVYNAKAHPHLSRPGELLISYNVNTLNGFSDHYDRADVYRPRWVRAKAR